MNTKRFSQFPTWFREMSVLVAFAFIFFEDNTSMTLCGRNWFVVTISNKMGLNFFFWQHVNITAPTILDGDLAPTSI